MHGAAVTFANQVVDSGNSYDLVLANDMMDVAVFKSLINSAGLDFPIACYFHENQLSYPVSPRDTDISASRDLHYGFINYTSALAADKIFFNSQYHLDNFIHSLPKFLASFPDFQNRESIGNILKKAEVLALGMNLRELDEFACEETTSGERPLLLWNHRWEYDKGPEAFLSIVLELSRQGLDFEIALLGERGSEQPAGLDAVRRQLGDRVLQDGPVDCSADYAGWLWRADILPVTSIQDFFGGSVVEAIYCGCHPVLPNRLSYPEHVSDDWYFYETEEEAVGKIAELIRTGIWRDPFKASQKMLRYDWSQLAASYDMALSNAVGSIE